MNEKKFYKEQSRYNKIYNIIRKFGLFIGFILCIFGGLILASALSFTGFMLLLIFLYLLENDRRN